VCLGNDFFRRESNPRLGRRWRLWDSHWVAVQGPKFTAQELSFDLFGSFIAEETDVDKVFETNIHGGKWGGGLGLNYFFLRELGISGDLNAADNGGEFIDLARR
jgi:hypothetical protein